MTITVHTGHKQWPLNGVTIRLEPEGVRRGVGQSRLNCL
jgi:hypothetical protein